MLGITIIIIISSCISLRIIKAPPWEDPGSQRLQRPDKQVGIANTAKLLRMNNTGSDAILPHVGLVAIFNYIEGNKIHNHL